MDPYLEKERIFRGFQRSFVVYLREALQPRLSEPYYAEIGSRFWVEGPITRPHDEVREPFLQIFSRFDVERPVTTVEVLSPANKTPGGQGRDLYLRKQREVLESQTHLVEIDLLRAGEHTTAVPRDLAIERAGPFDYHACVHRFDQFEDYFIYALRLEDRLPEVEIPLLPGDPSVPVDLQPVFERAYDTGPYRRRISYRTDSIVPPLDAARGAWAAGIVQGG